MQKIEEQAIFSEYVFKIKPTELEEFRQPLIDGILRLEETTSTQVHTNVGGWQSNYFQYMDPPPIDIIPSALNGINKYIIELKNRYQMLFPHDYEHHKNKTPQKPMEYWLSVNRRGDSVNYHDHLTYSFAAVWYLTMPKNASPITFHRENNKVNEWLHPITIGRQNMTPNQYNHSSFTVLPEEGELLIFPAWLKHSVPPSHTDEPRVNIGMNWK
jgi:hypothetical protein